MARPEWAAVGCECDRLITANVMADQHAPYAHDISSD